MRCAACRGRSVRRLKNARPAARSVAHARRVHSIRVKWRRMCVTSFYLPDWPWRICNCRSAVRAVAACQHPAPTEGGVLLNSFRSLSPAKVISKPSSSISRLSFKHTHTHAHTHTHSRRIVKHTSDRSIHPSTRPSMHPFDRSGTHSSAGWEKEQSARSITHLIDSSLQ